MKFYLLDAKNQHGLHGLIFSECEADDHIRIRKQYRPFCCKECGKPRELDCLESGLPSDVRFKGNWGFAYSDDLVFLAGRPFVEAVRKEGIGGIRFFALPDDTHYSVIWPTTTVAVDMPASTFDTRGPQCGTCGRFRSVSGNGMSIRGFESPPTGLTFFTGAIRFENSAHETPRLYAPESVVEILIRHKIKGLRFIEASFERGRTAEGGFLNLVIVE
jgi:hypothetical protein